MRKIVLTVIVAGLGLIGPITSAHAGLFSATGKVVAILADELFVGEAEGHLNGAGTLSIRSQKNPAVSCSGKFTSSAELGGSGQLQCSDGATATFNFKRVTVFRGFGVGNFSRGAMSFAYGFPVEEAVAYLKPPEGKKLTLNGAGLELVNQ